MTLATAFNTDLYRVQLSADSLGASATYAVVERSLNELLWLPVRGGTRLPVVAGEFDIGVLDDFEYFADTLNHYRVTSFDDSDVQQAQFTDSITPDHAGVTVLKSIRYPAVNRPVRLLDYGDPIERPSRSHVRPVAGQSTGVGVHDQRLGRQFVVHLITQGPDHLTEAGQWDIILTAATTWFIHTPAVSNIPGGYVAIGDTSQRAFHRGLDSAVLFRLPCIVERAPAPQITGTLLTAETVFRLYSDANALYAAHSTGRSLLATIADPSDVVVLS